MDDCEVRLRIVEAVVPQATRYSFEQNRVVEICAHFEKYVLGLQQGEELPDSPTRKISRPRKDKSSTDLPAFLDPATHGG